MSDIKPRAAEGIVLEPCAISGCQDPALERPVRVGQRTFLVACAKHAAELSVEGSDAQADAQYRDVRWW